MQHGQKIHDQPKELISKTGNEVLEIPEGTYVAVQLELIIFYIKKWLNHY